MSVTNRISRSQFNVKCVLLAFGAVHETEPTRSTQRSDRLQPQQIHCQMRRIKPCACSLHCIRNRVWGEFQPRSNRPGNFADFYSLYLWSLCVSNVCAGCHKRSYWRWTHGERYVARSLNRFFTLIQCNAAHTHLMFRLLSSIDNNKNNINNGTHHPPIKHARFAIQLWLCEHVFFKRAIANFLGIISHISECVHIRWMQFPFNRRMPKVIPIYYSTEFYSFSLSLGCYRCSWNRTHRVELTDTRI